MGERTCRAISREMLNPGDHICTERWKGLYYHHGIYVGGGMVIHVIGPKETGQSARKFRSASLKISSSATKLCPPECQNYLSGGTIKTCLDCFLDGHSLYFYDYESSPVRQHVGEHRGRIKSADEVVELAYNELKRDKFGDAYNIYGRNCEHFATYCKTGLAFSMQSIIWKARINAIFK